MPTTRANLIIPEILEEAIQGAFAGMTALDGTGAAVVNNSLPENNPQTGQRIKGGDVITVPYFDTLGELEDVVEGGSLTPATLTMTEEQAAVVHSGKMFEITYWAQLAANYADPYAEAARQLQVAARRRGDKALLDAALTTTLIQDITGATTPTINWDATVDAKLKWGDEQEDIVLMSVHSKVYGDLLKLKDADGRPLVVDPRDGSLPRFNGVPVKVSDRNNKVVDGGGVGVHWYDSLIVKRGALALWYTGTPRFLTDEDISADSLLGALHVYLVGHRYKRRPAETTTGVVKLRSQ
jgi:hypothetical protein